MWQDEAYESPAIYLALLPSICNAHRMSKTAFFLVRNAVTIFIYLVETFVMISHLDSTILSFGQDRKVGLHRLFKSQIERVHGKRMTYGNLKQMLYRGVISQIL